MALEYSWDQIGAKFVQICGEMMGDKKDTAK
jgi:hypothetical protein